MKKTSPITPVILTLIFLLTPTHPARFKTPFSLLESFLMLWRHAGTIQRGTIPEVPRVAPSYDFVIVGGGTAGCVLASRLTEDPRNSVLLVEAGRDEQFIYDIPILANYFQLTTETNWGHKTEAQNSACLGLTGHRCRMPRGKVMGGSSTINYMIYTRGNPKDYDGWKSLGNPGWGYDDILPYFQKLENVLIPEYRHTPVRGRGGPVTVSHSPYHTPLADTFLKAGQELGYKVLDYNGDNQVGFGYIQATLFNGTRMSSNRAYLRNKSNRKNLHVAKQTVVTRLLIDEKTKICYGVEMIRRGQRFKVMAKKEVILSAGALSSPQILMLSGIGPSEHLQKFKIPVISNLQVGYNLQDHIALGGFTFVVNKNVSLITERIIDDISALVNYFAFQKGPLSVPGGVEAVAFLNTKFNPDHSYPDIELLFGGGSLITDGTLRRCIGLKDDIYNAVYKPIEKGDAFTVFPMLLRPKSKGRVMLRSRSHKKLPIIYHNYLTEEGDIDVIVEGIRLAMKLSKTKAFKKFGTQVLPYPLPACRHLNFDSDEYWKCATRQVTLNIYHQCGTAKMGPEWDPGAVVDSQLRVYGVKGLRVVDASIMPFVPSGHTNGPTFMIAEKGADLIKNTWSKKSTQRFGY